MKKKITQLEHSSLENAEGSRRQGWDMGSVRLCGRHGWEWRARKSHTAHRDLGMQFFCRQKLGLAHSGEAAAPKKPLCAQVLSGLCSDPQHTPEAPLQGPEPGWLPRRWEIRVGLWITHPSFHTRSHRKCCTALREIELRGAAVKPAQESQGLWTCHFSKVLFPL